MKKLLRLVISAVLVCAMFMTVVPLSVFAGNDNEQQIVSRGGAAENKDDGVEVSKFIAPTDDENTFEITLTAKTRETSSVSVSKQETDVVIVLDISNTMNSEPGKSEPPKSGNNTRIHAAQEAAKNFVDKYCTYNSENDYKGKLSVVTFNTNADTALSLTDATNSTKDAIKQKIEAIAPNGKVTYNCKTQDDYKKSHDRFTNIEAGLKLAGNILDTSKAANKIVVLLTDGFPTTYIKSSADSTTKIKGYDPYTSRGDYGTDGIFYDGITGKHCNEGTSYSDKAATRAQDASTKLKEKGISIFSVGVDIGGQSISKLNETFKGKNFSVVDSYSQSTRSAMGLADYVIGSAKDAYAEWLGKTIAGGNAFNEVTAYADGSDFTALSNAFDKIYSTVEEINQKSNNNDLVVTDPMGPEIEFIGWSNASDKNEKTFVDSTETISWNLMKSTCNTQTDNNGTTYTYTLSYKVRLENENSGFVSGAAYEANGKTTLNYKITETGKQPVQKSIDFPLPTVKGFLADLTFEKKGTDGKLLEGAKFALTHDSGCCNVTISDSEAVSDKSGLVSFKNIPSGHKYTLKETESVSGYFITDTAKTYSVEVAYGIVKILDGNTDVTKDFAVINERKAPADVVLTATKLLDGKTPALDAFEFELLDKDEKVIDTAKNNENGAITFDEMTFSDAGTYEYTIREINTGAENIVYDTSVHNVKIVVSEGAKAYDATVTYDDKTDIPVFSNKTEVPTPTIVIEGDTPLSPVVPVHSVVPVTPVTLTEPVIPVVTITEDIPMETVKTSDENRVGATLAMIGICTVGVLVVSDKRRKTEDR